MMLRAGSIGTEVKSVVTSYDVGTLQGYPLGTVYKVAGTLYVIGDLPTRGFNTLVRTLATP